MAVFYILYSNQVDKFYIGSCLDFESRFKQHLTQEFEKAFTKRADDWKCILNIKNLEYDQARSIEKHVKKMKSRKYIQNLVSYPEMQQKLIKKHKTGSSRVQNLLNLMILKFFLFNKNEKRLLTILYE